MYGNGYETTNGELYLYNFLEPKCSVIFDVGSGEDTYYATNSSITYHMFESYQPVFEKYREKVKDKPNIKINNIALGAEKITLPFYFANGMSFVNRNGHAHSDVLIETSTLDDYVKSHGIDHIDFLKIDTEGWELNVLKGSIESFNIIPHIQFEYGGCWPEGGFHLQEAREILESHGYSLYIIIPQGITAVPDFSDHGRYCNYFATKKIEDVKEIIR